ncbi:MAG: MFS transporter [Chloroflexi bacterium]|nr:MFS transporter [Chloroflexota bacterium]
MSLNKRNERLYPVLIAFGTFIILGLPGGLGGVVWPSIRDEFGLGQDALGALLLAGTVGSMAAGLNNGRFLNRWGMGATLLGAAVFDALGFLGYGFAPSWTVLVALGLLTGAGDGLVDSAINTYVAEHHSARTMNWLHACYGLGATLGPLLMRLLFELQQDWRVAYWVVGLAKLAVVVALWQTRHVWRRAAEPAEGDLPAPTVRGRVVLRMPIVWISITLFFFYGGLEVTPAQWGYTYYTESRMVATTAAIWWTGLFWGVFTLGRFVLGAMAGWLGPVRLVRICLAVALAGAVLMWQPWSNLFSLAGMVLIGGALAPIFPTLVSLTPARVGYQRAAHAIGYQVGAGGIGIALLPALAGVLVAQWDLSLIAPFVVATAVIVIACHELLLWHSTAETA